MASHEAEGTDGGEVTDRTAWDKVNDEAALVQFRRAAAALGALAPGDPGGSEHAAEAAAALLALASSGDGAALRDILRPDPAGGEVAWTVACYQIGDLAPSALRDFGEPAAAVATLAACGQPTHLAAELLASTPLGLTWAALTRTGDTVSFQLLDSATGREDEAVPPPELEAEPPAGASLAAARSRWKAQLARWAVDPGAGLTARGLSGDGRSVARQVLSRLGIMEEQIEQLQGQLGELQAEVAGQRAAGPSRHADAHAGGATSDARS